MTFKDDLVAAKDDIVKKDFVTRDGTVVPVSTDVGFNEAVKLKATYLYADMANSSGLVAISPKETVGKVLRLYLDLSVRIIRKNGGHIRSFDGDRVMGIFIDDGRFNTAVKAAMQIKWACLNIIQPELNSRYGSIQKSGWLLKPGTGISSGEAFIIRGGVRRTGSDLVSVGLAPTWPPN
ncbi:adenylate/guanylate cyclase domain-containing protein [Modestobacter excelsi]|uniref:adenylate/guanylate cyclase domain-containing protein n=1 Tax=Modestobacter excelsi TaxID=2213161 RepID=UPI00110D118F|nr:adenylate/guanylate cyclase domain-containing protein [Modestobacter excelsi]